MEDTGLIGFLVSDHVGAPAQEGAEVHVGVGCVGYHAVARRGDKAAARQQARGQGVVEGPGDRGEYFAIKCNFGKPYYVTMEVDQI